MDITENEYLDHLSGFFITGCAVQNENRFYFLAHDYTEDINPVMSQPQIKQRLICYDSGSPAGQRWDSARLGGFQGAIIATAEHGVQSHSPFTVAKMFSE